MAMIELSFGTPCPDMRNRIHAIVDEFDAPGVATARRHLQKCTRCRSYAEGMKLQDRFVRNSKMFRRRNSAKKSIAAFSARRFESWLDNQLSQKAHSCVATEICRLGRSVLLLDADYRATSIPSGGRIEVLDFEKASRDFGSALVTTLALPHKHPTTIEMVDQWWRTADRAITTPSKFAGKAVEFAEEISRDNLWDLAHLRSLLEWYYGDDWAAEELFTEASSIARSPVQRAHSLHNRSEWRMDHLMTDKALRDSHTAIQLNPQILATRVSRVLWLLCLGRRRQAENEARDLVQLSPTSKVSTPAGVTRRVHALSSLLSIPASRQGMLVRSALDLLFGMRISHD